MENYIASLEKEFSLIENGFKEEEKRAFSDYRSNDKEFVKKLAFLAYNSNTYQVTLQGGLTTPQANIAVRVPADKLNDFIEKIKENTTNHHNEQFAWNETPYDLASLAYYYTGDYNKSLKYALEALKISPNDERIKNNFNIIKNSVNNEFVI